jgi:hypothetical protein
MALAMDKHRTFEELTEVSLTHAIEAQRFVMPRGATGVVMASYADELAYEVEFDSRRHMVLTLGVADIRPAKELMSDQFAGGRQSSD